MIHSEPKTSIYQPILGQLNTYDQINGEKEILYRYLPFLLIDSERFAKKSKWKRAIENGKWDARTHFAQGNAFLIRDDLCNNLFPICDLTSDCRFGKREHVVEPVCLDSGLYLGDRNTEPRSALVIHLIFNPKGNPKPMDIFVINIHLTTILRERKGITEVDLMAAEIRMDQIKKIFRGIISRYNAWKEQGFLDRGGKRDFESWETGNRLKPIWILAGDFNFTPVSLEYKAIQRMKFLDIVPTKGLGTKARRLGNEADITVDYIFAWPMDILIDSELLAKNHVLNDIKISDHFPIYAEIPIRNP